MPLPSSEKSYLPHNEWGNLAEHLTESFYQPDLDALRVALSVYCAHWLYLDNRPTWPLFIGIPGSGKSEIICTALGGLEGVVIASDITPHTFISGANSNLNGTSLLKQLVPLANNNGRMLRTHGILVFKDFTSIMELRPDYRTAITSQMREIWDGRYDPRKGVKVERWEGKLTVQAVVTPAFESAWGIKRNLGERFTGWRTHTGNGIEMARSALRQQHHNTIAKRTRDLTCAVMPSSYHTPPTIPITFNTIIAHAAQYAAILRTHVERDTFPPRSILGGSQPEAPTRLAMSMAQIAAGHAHLRGADTVDEQDVELALRAARYAVPRVRQMIVEQLGPQPVMRHIVVKATGLPESTITWNADELESLGVIEKSEDNNTVFYTLSSQMVQLRQVMHGKTATAKVIQFPAEAANEA